MNDEKLADLLRRYHHHSVSNERHQRTLVEMLPKVIAALKGRTPTVIDGRLYEVDGEGLLVRKVEVLS